MKVATVTFDNKETIITRINGTDKEIKEYYRIGRVFNLGCGNKDFMTRVVSVKIEGLQCA